MAPLIVMLVSWAAARLAGFTGLWPQVDAWDSALRVALAAMFVFTAVSHFHPRTRPDLVRMVPPKLRKPALLVPITGVLELLGAAGLLVPSVSETAAYGLIALLVAMFPANLHAARAGLVIAGRRATPIVWRAPLQLFWIGALWWVAQSTPLERTIPAAAIVIPAMRLQERRYVAHSQSVCRNAESLNEYGRFCAFRAIGRTYVEPA